MAGVTICTWDDVEEGCRRLTDLIDESFDAVVCVLRGGAVPGVILANALDIDLVLAIKVEQRGQRSGATRGSGVYAAEKAAIVVPLNGVGLQGRRVLIVDDVLDSGNSIAVVVDEVTKAGAVLAKVAALHVKSRSRIKPDYYIEERREWLFYPWMSERELRQMEAALSQAEAARR